MRLLSDSLIRLLSWLFWFYTRITVIGLGGKRQSKKVLIWEYSGACCLLEPVHLVPGVEELLPPPLHLLLQAGHMASQLQLLTGYPLQVLPRERHQNQ